MSDAQRPICHPQQQTFRFSGTCRLNLRLSQTCDRTAALVESHHSRFFEQTGNSALKFAFSKSSR